MKVKLSPQQARALTLYGQGQSLREISIALGVSYNRVLNIINEILAKIDIMKQIVTGFIGMNEEELENKIK